MRRYRPFTACRKIECSRIIVDSFIKFNRAGKRMQDHGIWFPASQHNRIDSILLQPTNVCHPLRTYWSLVHDIYFTNYAVNIGFYFVTNSMLVEVLEDIGFQLQLGRLTKKILTPSNLERRYA